jgi:hypothetical protein
MKNTTFSSGIYLLIAKQKLTYVSEEYSASIFNFEMGTKRVTSKKQSPFAAFFLLVACSTAMIWGNTFLGSICEFPPH